MFFVWGCFKTSIKQIFYIVGVSKLAAEQIHEYTVQKLKTAQTPGTL